MTLPKQALNKADLHIHTVFSDGLMSPETLVEYVAEKTDLRVIAVTDHDTLAGARVAQAYCRHFPDDFGHLEVIIGSEITSADGDILALFIEQDVPRGLSAAETVEHIHNQGGLAVAAHPYAAVFPLLRMEGMQGVKGLIRQLPFDGIEVRNATPTEFLTNPLTAWKKRGIKSASTGGSDTHYLPTVGSTYTWFPGERAADLRLALETQQTRAGGHVYSPFYIVSVLKDLMSRHLPVRDVNKVRGSQWPLWTEG